MILTQYIGDTKTYELPLTWEGAAATLEAGEIIIFSAKYKSSDTDDQAVFQKALGAGLTVDVSTCTLDVLRADTINQAAAVSLVCDVQATKLDGSVRTLWIGRLKLLRDITRLTQTSTPVNTTETPLPVILPGWEVVNISEDDYLALDPEEQLDPTKIYFCFETL